MESADLNLFNATGWIKASSIENITEQQIIQCIVSRGNRLLAGEHRYVIKESTKSLNMKMNIVEREDRIWTFYTDYLNLLEAARYKQLPDR